MSEDRKYIPEKIQKVIDHYNKCFPCIHCNDCIAFALIYSEALYLRIPPRGVPYVVSPGHAWNFVKFLASTISKEYLPCDRALHSGEVEDFAWSLLRLSIEQRRDVRDRLLAHAEFKDPSYTNGVAVLGG